MCSLLFLLYLVILDFLVFTFSLIHNLNYLDIVIIFTHNDEKTVFLIAFIVKNSYLTMIHFDYVS